MTTYTQAQLDAAVTAAVHTALAGTDDRLEKFRLLAAGYGARGHAISTDEIAAAMTAGTTVEDFALEHADKCAAKLAATGQRNGYIAALQSDEEFARRAAASTGRDYDPNSADAVTARILKA